MHDPVIIDGKRMVMVNIFPVQYNAERKTVRLLNEIIITIENYEKPAKAASALSINETVAAELNVYPNPASDVLNISYELESQSGVAVDVYTLAGQRLYSKNMGAQAACLQNASIDISGVAAGVYSLVLRTEKGNAVKQVVVE